MSAICSLDGGRGFGLGFDGGRTDGIGLKLIHPPPYGGAACAGQDRVHRADARCRVGLAGVQLAAGGHAVVPPLLGVLLDERLARAQCTAFPKLAVERIQPLGGVAHE